MIDLKDLEYEELCEFIKGLGEAKICAVYTTITLLMGVLAIISVLVGRYGI